MSGDATAGDKVPGRRISRAGRLAVTLVLAVAGLVALAAPTVPTDVQLPGTQPLEVEAYIPPSNCKNCHGGTTNPDFEPWFGWQGSMMAHASRDPLFWAALAIAEQDFLPNPDPNERGGAGDFCLRCHLPGGWTQGRSEPTDGSAMQPSTDANGVECMHCHVLVDPDPPVNIPGTVEEQNAPFIANDGLDGWYGSGMYVLNSEGSRLGPYADAAAPTNNHDWKPSSFHRDAALCGTCHDVSNPVVGDLAHNNGAPQPLAPGSFSGLVGDAVADKAAFNNPPHAYGVVERTYSEWKASAFSTLRVNDFDTLPSGLQAANGSLKVARDRAWRSGDSTADYADGTPRYYTCQTCHMSASTGKGCKQGQAPVRSDLPRHDLTGSGYWVPEMILWQDDHGTLRFGGGLTSDQRAAMAAGQLRASALLQSAALLEASDGGAALDVRVTNLTGHKLITGYPEGRRMWLNVEWYDGPNGTGTLIHEDGGYGQLGVTVQDLDGDECAVESLLDLDAVRFVTEPGIDEQWAGQLIGFGLDPGMPLTYDRLTGEVTETLGSLAAKPPGAKVPSFHFVLNNVTLDDTRIPPFGFSHDAAAERNALPVPATQFGDPGPGGIYDHWSDHAFVVPPGAQSARVSLLFQQTSWEYVQFLWLHNDQQNAFLADEGLNLLDAWCNTGQSPPLEMASVTVSLGGASGLPGEASRQGAAIDPLRLDYDPAGGTITLHFSPACDATNHTVYRGPLADVSGYGYHAAECNVGSSGSATIPAGTGDEFFLVVGNNGEQEGSYGTDSAGTARPEDIGTPSCDYPREVGPTCDP